MVPAQLNGWRRHWQARTEVIDQDVALLSIHRDPACSVKGMIVIDRLSNLPLVDEREVGYDRHSIASQDIEILGPVASKTPDVVLPEALYVYVARKPFDASQGGPLLQSYCDAVMQGFRNEFGNDGVRHFIETTAGFEREIITDREVPKYPRHVILGDDEKDLFDSSLSKAGVAGL